MGFLLVVGLVMGPTVAYATEASLAATAADVRTDVITLSGQYERQYGPLVTSAERTELRGMSREARREMNTLVRLITKAERTSSPRDWRRAYQHYSVIRVTGDARLKDAQEIIAPRMTFTEQLSAWSRARSVLGELDSLGAELQRRSR